MPFPITACGRTTDTGCRCCLMSKHFHGRFVFEGETMTWMDMTTGIVW